MLKLFSIIIYFIGLALIFIIVSIWIFFGIELAYGQDIDSRYVCLYENQYPFSEMCNDSKTDKLYDQLLERAKEFNERH